MIPRPLIPHHTATRHAMDYDTTTDIAALEAELDALLAADAAMHQRLDALLAQPVVIHSISGRLAALQQVAAEHTAALDAIEAEQVAISAQLD